jgi:6-phosphogluconolactonase
MEKQLEIGDHVKWNLEAGYVSGKIVQVHTTDFNYKGYKHHASEEDPQYEIKSDNSHHIAAHKGSALSKLANNNMEKPILNVFENVEELLNTLAAFLIKSANEAIEEKGDFTLCLSGGNSPKKLYELLVSDAFRNEVDWNKVYFFLGDERYVPTDNHESNALMVRNALFNPLKIAKTHIFTVDTSLTPEAAARDYHRKIKSYFGSKSIQFDFILLGLGNNVHTASLFPYNPILADKEASVRAVFIEELKAYRITFTAPLINQANKIVFLVYGEDKAEAVAHALGKKKDFKKYPAQLIHPDHGSVYWFLDDKATNWHS